MARKRRSKKIPPCNSPIRTILASGIFEFPDYKEKLKQGYPIFKKNELEEIGKRYKNKYQNQGQKLSGLTWDNIEIELLKKNIVLKKPTFRKYIQDSHLPKSIGYVTIEKLRLALFPLNIINEINFLNYIYKIADMHTYDLLIAVLERDLPENQLTYLEAIMAVSDYDNIWAAIYYYLGFSDGDIEFAIEEVLEKHPEDKKKVITMLEELDEKFNSVIVEGASKIHDFLQEKKISYHNLPKKLKNI